MTNMVSLNDKAIISKAAEVAVYARDLYNVSNGEKTDGFETALRRAREVAEERYEALLGQIDDNALPAAFKLIDIEMAAIVDGRKFAMARGQHQRDINTMIRQQQEAAKAAREAKKAAEKVQLTLVA